MANQKRNTPNIEPTKGYRYYKITGLPGYYSSLKGGTSKNDFHNSPTQAKVRDNINELKGVSQAVKAIRHPLIPFKSNWSTYITGQLTKAIRLIQIQDSHDPKEKRPIKISQFPTPLIGFEFNLDTHFHTAFPTPFTLSHHPNRTQAALEIPSFNPSTLFKKRSAATHFRISLTVFFIPDFFFDSKSNLYTPSPEATPFNGLTATTLSEFQNIHQNELPPLTLSAQILKKHYPPTQPYPTTDTSLISTLQIQYYQKENDKYLPLKANTAMKIESIV